LHPATYIEFKNLENDASQSYLQGKFNNISTTDPESIEHNGEVLKQNQQKQNLCMPISFNSTLNKLILLACMEPIILSKYLEGLSVLTII
jgi:hypothetical protein